MVVWVCRTTWRSAPKARSTATSASRGGPAPVRHYDIDGGLLDAVLKGEINPGRVFTAEYDLDHIQDAYEAMDQRKVIKALIRF